jgi:hypothetical protein
MVRPPQERQALAGVEGVSLTVTIIYPMDIHRVKRVWTEKMSNGYPLAMADENRKHTQGVLLRFEPEQLEMIDQAAEHAGLNRTAWLRASVLRAAREELGEGGKGKKRPS